MAECEEKGPAAPAPSPARREDALHSRLSAFLEKAHRTGCSEEEWTWFVETVQPRLAPMARAVIGARDPGRIGDLVCGVVCDIFDKRVRYRKTGASPFSFLFGVLLRKARKLASRRSRVVLESELPGDAPPLESTGASGRNEVAETVREALEALPVDHREILHLRYFENWSPAEIAELLRLSLDTARKRVTAARDAFRQAMRKFGHRG